MIPKSLHTVSSLVNLARYLASTTNRKPEWADLLAARNILGYAGTPDPHGLMDVAMRKLAK